MPPILELKDVYKEYVEKSVHVRAVNGVSLSVEPGEMLLVMGPSGSGKTTLLSMMGCILRVTSGRISVQGRDVSSLGEEDLPMVRKAHYGFVFQSYNLFPSLTASENVAVVLRLKGLAFGAARAESERLLGLVGLEDRTDFYPADLSGGQKQRVAFARALAGDPPIILADEPTANLDSGTGREVLALLKSHAAERGRTVVVVSHDPKAEAFADRIIVLEDGRIKQ